MRGEQVVGVAGADALQAGDEIGQVRAVMGVDDAHAAVAEDVVAREEEVAHPERELAGRMSGRAPDFELRLPTSIASPSSIVRSTLHRGMGMWIFWASIRA